MKVLQVINSLGTGGAEKLIADYVPLMNQKGVAVDVLILSDLEGPFLERVKKNNVKVINLNARSFYSPLNIFKMAKYIGEYDVVHSHLFPANYFTALAKIVKPFSNKKVKLVTTEHNNTNRRFERKYLQFIDRFIYNRYAALIAITPSIKQVLWERIGHPDISIVYNAVNIQELYNAQPVPFPENQVNLLMVASFSDRKDHGTIIKAIAQLDNKYHLYLAGKGPMERTWRELCRNLNIENRVHFLGSRKDVPGLMKAADLNILSSNWEGLSCAALEAMASGTPFLGTDINGIKELFVDNDFALFSNGDVEGLVEKINRITKDESFSKLQAETNFTAVQQYDIEIMTEHYLEIYKRVMQKN
ncbi:MAG: glycosyltransferase [Agriterribacter sp.]